VFESDRPKSFLCVPAENVRHVVTVCSIKRDESEEGFVPFFVPREFLNQEAMMGFLI
jgi:hypothetical protein